MWQRIFGIIWVLAILSIHNYGVTFSQKLGQSILLGVTQSTLSQPLRDLIQQGHIAGVVLLGSEFSNAITAKKFIEDIQTLNKRFNHPPLIISIDQEGGSVNRIKRGIKIYESAATYGQINSSLNVYHMAKNNAESLSQLGINMILGPVADLKSNQGYINTRAFSNNYSQTQSLVSAYVSGVSTTDVHPVIKHFPGHGAVIEDTHTQSAVVSDQDWELHLRPFIYMLNKPQVNIMISHITNHHLDTQNPSSLSKKIITKLLKNTLNFKGLIISDDLNMSAITTTYSLTAATKKALLAGNHLVIISAAPQRLQTLIHTLNKHSANNPAFNQQLDQAIKKTRAFRRTISLKL